MLAGAGHQRAITLSVVIIIFIIMCSAGAESGRECESRTQVLELARAGFESQLSFYELYKMSALGPGPGSCLVTNKGSLY